jgi:tRNA modification GTPase
MYDDGLDLLKLKIRELFNMDSIEKSDLNYLSSAREISTIKTVLKMINDIEVGLKNNVEIDMLEIDIKGIWELLGKLIGEIYDDELIDNLFSRFCLGK